MPQIQRSKGCCKSRRQQEVDFQQGCLWYEWICISRWCVRGLKSASYLIWYLIWRSTYFHWINAQRSDMPWCYHLPTNIYKQCIRWQQAWICSWPLASKMCKRQPQSRVQNAGSVLMNSSFWSQQHSLQMIQRADLALPDKWKNISTKRSIHMPLQRFNGFMLAFMESKPHQAEAVAVSFYSPMIILERFVSSSWTQIPLRRER